MSARVLKQVVNTAHHSHPIFHRSLGSALGQSNAFSSSASSDENGADKETFMGGLPSKFSPETVESGVYEKWQRQGYFQGIRRNDVESKPDHFSVLFPPPNVTGTLHLGHALTTALQDAMVRWNRASGVDTLWIPGTDHAGIATQVVVEKHLAKTRPNVLNRHDVGREAFIDAVWEWKETKGSTISSQLRRMGASLDWSQEFFTMDEPRSLAVSEAFVQLADQGLVYRDARLVHWCPALRTALSDIEVDHVDVSGPTELPLPGGGSAPVGVLHHFTYPIWSEDGSDTGQGLVVATTRIETMLADAGVAVHPEDERYKQFHGGYVRHPLTGAKLPIVTDSFVDPEFGTGAVKLTPGHDASDYAVAKRTGLGLANMLADDGTILPEFGDVIGVSGMDRMAARAPVIAALQEARVYQGVESHTMRVAVCSRTGDVIEPLVRPQWYISMSPLAQRVAEQTRRGELTFQPDSEKASWFRWLDNIQDWCVSRQLWWGHQIPAWRLEGAAPQEAGSDAVWVIARSEEEAKAKAEAAHGPPGGSWTRLVRDEDVFDTWFSSGLLPLAALGWPRADPETILKWYPMSVMETGSDILFFWVARMAMLCGWLVKDDVAFAGAQLPFNHVYLHAMIRDAHGRKMSKSLGNVIDPVDLMDGKPLSELIEGLQAGNLAPSEVAKSTKTMSQDFPDGIPECGADALRWSLLEYSRHDHAINLDVAKVATARTFANKVWQGARLVASHTHDTPVKPVDEVKLGLGDEWILNQLNDMVDQVNTGFGAYEFSDVTDALRRFWIGDFCDVWLEWSKPAFYGHAGLERQEAARAVGRRVLDTWLRAAHPALPFLTDVLYAGAVEGVAMDEHFSSLGSRVGEYPKANVRQEYQKLGLMKSLLEVAGGVRSQAGLPGAPPTNQLSLGLDLKDAQWSERHSEAVDGLKRLTGVGAVELESELTAGQGSVMELPDGSGKWQLRWDGDGVDEGTRREAVAALSKRVLKAEKEHAKIVGRMKKDTYESRVPLAVQAKDRVKKEELEALLRNLSQMQELLESP